MRKRVLSNEQARELKSETGPGLRGFSMRSVSVSIPMARPAAASMVYSAAASIARPAAPRMRRATRPKVAVRTSGPNFWGFEGHGVIPDIVTLG